ncbi:Thymidylate kinase [hydrothermal vent metagenome]|uniref:Thymidylate kinase n=1 Tax=hydrothermal vent metagenome TaxID=652676 RepID=A0A1W1CQL6_9ZZZZ
MKILFLISMILFSLNAKEFSNELQFESSPYLLSHKNNPVNWLPWSKKAFAQAKRENKAIFLSLGYSTCHWCHVMEEDSFSNEKLAKLFNKYFICIKVDREEMPHLDALYQEVYLKIRHHSGGWPLSLFMTPQKEVYYAATYIPAHKQPYSEGLDTLLEKLGEMYQINDTKFKEDLAAIQQIINAKVVYEEAKETDISVNTLSESLKENIDDIYSGFGSGRKFPEASKLSLMMDLAEINSDEELEAYSYEMLDVMALRGLYDQVEGGFFRYTVDAAWEIPHFEKMLYDQAELIPIYVRAYLKTGKKLYKNVVVETIAMLDKHYVKDDLYYSASDADTNHEEGAYFIFTQKDLKGTGVEYVENFEDKMHLNIYENQRPKNFQLKVRSTREYPFIDKKINTAWNALMIEALYSASIIDKKYKKKADKTLKALSELMFKNYDLYHQTIIGMTPRQKGLLEDYSFFIGALIAGYEVDYDKDKLDFAEYLLNHANAKFYKKGVWYLSDDNLDIKAGLIDKYYASPLSKMLQNIINIASLKASFRYEKLALATLEPQMDVLKFKQSDAPALAKAYLMQNLKVTTIKSKKQNLLKYKKEIQTIAYPYVLTKEEKYDDYLACTIRLCYSKDKNIKTVIKAINSKRRW